MVQNLAAGQRRVAVILKTASVGTFLRHTARSAARVHSSRAVAATPDITLARDAEHTGTAQCALMKLRPRLANASMCGVRARMPAHKPHPIIEIINGDE